MKKPLAALYSILLVLISVFLLSAPFAAAQSKGKDKSKEKKDVKAGAEEKKADEEEEEDVLPEDEDEEDLTDEEEEEVGGTAGDTGHGGLSLGKPGLKTEEEEKEGALGGGELAPPSFFGTSVEEGKEGEVKEEEGKEGEGVKKEEAKEKGKAKVTEEPKWLETTTKFFDMTGYFRFRSDLFYRFDMGFPADNENIPFPAPYESRITPEVDAGYRPGEYESCGSAVDTPDWCGKHLLTGANIRLRIEPVISLSEMVKIKAQFDILDNLSLGSTPEGYSNRPTEDGLAHPDAPDPWVPVIAFSGTQVPPDWRNSLSNPISVRTVWGEVLLKNIGMLKFGRMPSAWGLGLLANDGRCLDCNYGDIQDRVIFSTKFFDTIFAAGWDFPVAGPTSQTILDMQGQAYDVSAADDVYQWLGVIAYKLEKEEEERKLGLGKPVFAGGVYYLYRQQKLSAMENSGTAPGADQIDVLMVERNASAHIGDLWFKFLKGDFRAELEFVMIGGSIGNLGISNYTGESINVFQFGGVLQLEQTFLDDSLVVKFETGYASGDQNNEGLSPQGGLLNQNQGSGSTLMSRESWATAFRFDPDYHVDIILFREIIGAMSASYYFKPSVAYWFVKNHFYGQLDIIYSRASEFVSTTGNNGNLGVEFDLSLIYKTKDRFSGMLQFAYLIPLDAWKELEALPNAVRSLDHPLSLQLMLAIEF